MKFEIYQDAKSEWRWRFKAASGNIIATASEGYVHKKDCEHSIELVKKSSAAPVSEAEK